MIKVLFVYAHLIAACVAISVLFIQDLALASWRGRAMDAKAITNLQNSAGIVTYSLVALWITGLVIVAIGYLDNPAYIMNQKLWGKFSVVIILTLNGLILHRYSFPKLVSPQGYLGARSGEQLLVLMTAVISIISWLYSCYLGIARHWNNVAPYGYVMMIYVAVLAITLLVALVYWRELRSDFRPVNHQPIN